MSQLSSSVVAAANAASAFTKLEREKTVLLEELVSLRCDDIAKVLEVDESLIVDSEPEHYSTCCSVYDAWHHGNQALRQMYSASHRAPRLRRFPTEDLQQQQQQQKRLQRQRLQPIRPTADQIRRVIRPPPPPTPSSPQPRSPPTSSVISDVEVKHSDPEEMLTGLADCVVSKSLSAATDAAQLHLTAVRLVSLTVDRAEGHLRRFSSGARASSTGTDSRASSGRQST